MSYSVPKAFTTISIIRSSNPNHQKCDAVRHRIFCMVTKTAFGGLWEMPFGFYEKASDGQPFFKKGLDPKNFQGQNAVFGGG